MEYSAQYDLDLDDHIRLGRQVGVHSIFGAIVGALIGWRMSFYLPDTTSTTGGLLCIIGGALLFGFLAGACTDEFWKALRR